MAENLETSVEGLKVISPSQIDAFIADMTGDHTGMLALVIAWGVRILLAMAFLAIGWFVGNWINRQFEGAYRLDPTLRNFLGNFAKYLIIVVTIITVVGLFGIPMASLLAVMGAAGLAIGLALQGTLSNVASGVMILILRPFNVGDYIAFGEQEGTVQSLGLFGTELSTLDNIYLYAPNSKIWGDEIKNYSRNSLRRQDIKVNIAYQENLNQVFDIINNLVYADSRILKDEGKQPEIIVNALGDFSINLIVRFWSKSGDTWPLNSEMMKRIKEDLEQNKIAVPYPTRVEIVKNLRSDGRLN